MGWLRQILKSLRAAAWCVLVVFCAHGTMAQDDVPSDETVEESAPVSGYKATVQSQNVYLRSGPSFGHYPTEKIARGSSVEVYRTAPGGWVGVRPLESSYCWIPASAIERDADDETIGRVIDRPVEAWIASNVERVKRHQSQVVLEPGEEVFILGERTREGDEPWYKIAPPRGEFRWVHSKHLSTKSPKQLADDDARKEIDRAKQLIETGVLPNPTDSSDPKVADAKPPKSGYANVAPREHDDEAEGQYIQDEALEQAAFGDGIKRVGKRIREGYLGQRIFGPTQPREEAGDRFDVGEGNVSIGKSTARNGEGEDAEIDLGDDLDGSPSKGRSSPRESTYGKDETRPFPNWAKRRDDGATAADGDLNDQTADRQPIDLSPPGQKKEPAWAAGNKKRVGSSVNREDRLASHDRSSSTHARSERTPKPRELNGYDDDEALTVSPAIERGLEELDRELTIMASRDSSAWNMGALREYGEQLLSRARTPLERGRVRLLLDRIVAFESTAPESGARGEWNAPATRPDTNVASRPDQPALPRDQNSPSTPTGDIFQPPQTSARRNNTLPTQPTFDGFGQLMPVYDNVRKGLPPYQLVDDDGNFLRYVTPEPGVNLRRYERKQVGLYGPRGYIESLGKDHLTARRVVDLDQIRR
jgi:hypothetical protein